MHRVLATTHHALHRVLATTHHALHRVHLTVHCLHLPITYTHSLHSPSNHSRILFIHDYTPCIASHRTHVLTLHRCTVVSITYYPHTLRITPGVLHPRPHPHTHALVLATLAHSHTRTAAEPTRGFSKGPALPVHVRCVIYEPCTAHFTVRILQCSAVQRSRRWSGWTQRALPPYCGPAQTPFPVRRPRGTARAPCDGTACAPCLALRSCRGGGGGGGGVLSVHCAVPVPVPWKPPISRVPRGHRRGMKWNGMPGGLFLLSLSFPQNTPYAAAFFFSLSRPPPAVSTPLARGAAQPVCAALQCPGRAVGAGCPVALWPCGPQAQKHTHTWRETTAPFSGSASASRASARRPPRPPRPPPRQLPRHGAHPVISSQPCALHCTALQCVPLALALALALAPG